MPALNFNARWADAVEIGARMSNGASPDIIPTGMVPKNTTIRLPGRAKPGQTLYLYTGQRTKRCRRLGVVVCLAVTPLRLIRADDGGCGLQFDGVMILTPSWLDHFAENDTAGLWNWAQLSAFLAKSYPGQVEFELIGW